VINRKQLPKPGHATMNSSYSFQLLKSTHKNYAGQAAYGAYIILPFPISISQAKLKVGRE